MTHPFRTLTTYYMIVLFRIYLWILGVLLLAFLIRELFSGFSFIVLFAAILTGLVFWLLTEAYQWKVENKEEEENE